MIPSISGTKYRTSLQSIFWIFVLALVVSSCGSKNATNAGENKVNTLKYADHLKMWEENDGTTFAEVYNQNDTTKPLALYIFPDKGKAEDYKRRFPDSVVVTEHTGNFLVYTSVYSSALDEMGVSDKIGAVVDAGYFTDPSIRDAIASGKILDAGTSQQPSQEKLIARKPSLAMVSVYDGMDVSTLKKLNIPVVYMADNLEATPLGRAEWIKFIAHLAGKPETGDSIFRQVESEYLKLKDMASKSTDRPKVMVENMYQGVWYVPGGKSYAAELISDAGGNYPWKDNGDNGSLSLSFEQVLHKASDTDVWLLKLFNEELTSDGLKAKDERNMLFAPVAKHGVWYSNTATSRLFDEFPYHPELLLRDYIAIFHPTILQDYTPRYFRPMNY